MIKVLGLALYGPLAASTRYRLSQYKSGLKSMGIDLQIRHLLDDHYLRQLFEYDRLSYDSIARGVVKRISRLRRTNTYDIAIVYCELFPMIPAWIERLLIDCPYIYDFDDAFYLKYSRPRFRWFQSILSTKFENLILGASAVTAGNHVLEEYARRFNPQTVLLPTVVDTTRFRPLERTKLNAMFTVGWIGSPSTAPYLRQLVQPLTELGREGPVRFIVIGGKAPTITNVETIEITWNESTEVDLLNQFDVGVMPLPDDDWARGKCAFKLIQYMACEVSVIASPVGANIDVVSPDCGFLASSSQDWLEAFRQLRDHPVARRMMGQSGRRRIVKDYSLTRNLPLFAQLIRQVARK